MESMPAPASAGHRRGRHPPGDPRGRRPGPDRAAAWHPGVPASTRGYVALVTWAERFGPVERIGIEGTGTYGAGLARFVRAYGLAGRRGRPTRPQHPPAPGQVRPDRRRGRRPGHPGRGGHRHPQDPRGPGRDDPGAAGGPPRRDEGPDRRRRAAARRGRQRPRRAAPATARSSTTKALVRACAALRPGPLHQHRPRPPRPALRTLARRWQQLQAELDALDTQLQKLVAAAAPTLVALPGVGIDTAGQLLVTAGDNPERLRSEAAFAHLCGVAPIPASSGRTDRHRLNRGGDRQANHALWRIALVRMHCHPPTRTYVERRTKQGLSKPEIMRCLKRYIAREIYHHLVTQPTAHPVARNRSVGSA